MRLAKNPTPESDKESISLIDEVIKLLEKAEWIKVKTEAGYGFKVSTEIAREKVSFYLLQSFDLNEGQYGATLFLKDGSRGIIVAIGENGKPSNVFSNEEKFGTLIHEIVHLLDAARYRFKGTTHDDKKRTQQSHEKYLKHGIESNARILTALYIMIMVFKPRSYFKSILSKMFDRFVRTGILNKRDKRAFLTRSSFLLNS
jgi:hypothetical protein